MTLLFQQLAEIYKESIQSQDISDIDTYDILVDQLYQEAEINSKFFALRFDQLSAIFYQLLKNYQTQGTTLTICSHLFQVLVAIVQKRPSLIKKNMNRLVTLVQYLYEMFNMIDFQLTENWIKPIEGYVQENDFSEENTLTKQIMSYFDRIARAYTYSSFHEFFSQLLTNLWNNSSNNWKGRYTLLMLMSQLGEQIQDVMSMKSFIQCGIQSISHQHPKVRYAALQMFGQLADDMKPHFQSAFGEKLFPAIIGCTKDQIPRIQGHSMACLTNLLQNFELQSYYILTPYIDQIINVAQNFCFNSISFVKQSSVSALSSLATIDILTGPQIQKVLGIINHLLTFEGYQKLEYKQLINQTLQCLSMLMYGQSNQKIQSVLNQGVNILKSLKDKVDSTYLLNAWSRLCLKHEKFTDLSDIFPYFLEKVGQMVLNYESQVKHGAQSILNTIDSFKQNIKPYAVQILQFCKSTIKIQNQGPGQQLKEIMYDIMFSLLMNLKCQAPDPSYDQLAKNIFTFIYQEIRTILNQYLSDTQNDQQKDILKPLRTLQQIIPYFQKIMVNQDSTKFLQNIFDVSLIINQLITLSKQVVFDDQNKLSLATDQMDKQQLEALLQLDQNLLDKYYEARLIIPDIFQQVFKIMSKQSAKLIIEKLYPYISGILQSNMPFQDIRYGLYFLCDFLTALGYEGIQSYAQIYQSKFCQFSLSSNLQIRNVAVYGLGQFMKAIPAQKTDQNLIYKWLNVLWNSLNISFDNNVDKKKFSFARDNIVSALGKLIQSKRTYYPVALNQDVHKKWCENLPLNYDKVEGNIQHEILLNLLDQTPETFIANKEDVFNLLTIFAKYFAKRMNKKDDIIIKNKTATKNYLFKMKDWPVFQQNSDFLWSHLPQNYKNILTQLMSAP